MSKLNVLVEECSSNHFKCINTKIMEVLKAWQKTPDIGWTKTNNYIWETYHSKPEHFNFISVEDFKEEDKLNPTIYLVTIPFINDHLNTTWVRWLPDSTLKLLKENNIPIVLSQPHEYFLGHLEHFSYHHFYPSEEMARLSSVLDQKGLFTNDIIIHGISATSSKPGFMGVGHRKVYEAYCYDYFANGKRFIDDWTGQDLTNPKMARYKYLTFRDHYNEGINKDKTSVCFNRQPRDLRCLLLLCCEAELDSSVFTFLAEDPINVPMTNDDIEQRLNDILDSLPQSKYVNKLRRSIIPLINKMPLELQELEGERVDHMNANYALNQERKRAWFEMVTETHEWNKKDLAVSIITEKTIWPIVNNMPFCVQGHKENYEFLKNLGFNLFEDSLLNQEALKRDIIHEDLDKSSLFATEQMYERFNAWYKNIKFLQDAKAQIKHNFELLAQTDWKAKEKDDFIKICNHSKRSESSSDIFLENKFKF